MTNDSGYLRIFGKETSWLIGMSFCDLFSWEFCHSQRFGEKAFVNNTSASALGPALLLHTADLYACLFSPRPISSFFSFLKRETHGFSLKCFCDPGGEKIHSLTKTRANSRLMKPLPSQHHTPHFQLLKLPKRQKVICSRMSFSNQFI